MSVHPPKKLKLLSVQKIWDLAPHNAFTDLLRFHQRWWCVFRESDQHVRGNNGDIRLIFSDDEAQSWNSAVCLSKEGIDLRDPKLSETPDGRMMLLVGGTAYQNKRYVSRHSYVAFSQDGFQWSSLQKISLPEEWLWRVTWHQGIVYGAAYHHSDPQFLSKEWILSLLSSHDGLSYQLMTAWDIPGLPNEATVRFLPSGEMVALVRREKKKNNKSWIGFSSSPYKDWKWHETGYYLGGPNFLILEDGSMWASGRVWLKNPYGIFSKTIVASMDTKGGLIPALILPSHKDTGYPGMVYHEGQLWISYYSSHEGKSAIYLARLALSDTLFKSS